MKAPNYKTLLYMQALGCGCDDLIRSGQYQAVKGNIEHLSDYELMYYHCKLLKMPAGTFDKGGIIMAMFHNVIAEYEQREEDKREAEQEERTKSQAKAETLQKIYRAILLYFGVLVGLVLVLSLVCLILCR